jgi:hypothetical protein
MLRSCVSISLAVLAACEGDHEATIVVTSPIAIGASGTIIVGDACKGSKASLCTTDDVTVKSVKLSPQDVIELTTNSGEGGGSVTLEFTAIAPGDVTVTAVARLSGADDDETLKATIQVREPARIEIDPRCGDESGDDFVAQTDEIVVQTSTVIDLDARTFGAKDEPLTGGFDVGSLTVEPADLGEIALGTFEPLAFIARATRGSGALKSTLADASEVPVRVIADNEIDGVRFELLYTSGLVVDGFATASADPTVGGTRVCAAHGMSGTFTVLTPATCVIVVGLDELETIEWDDFASPSLKGVTEGDCTVELALTRTGTTDLVVTETFEVGPAE